MKDIRERGEKVRDVIKRERYERVRAEERERETERE